MEDTPVSEELPADITSHQSTATLFPISDGIDILGLRVEDSEGKKIDIKRGNESSDWVLVSQEGNADQDAINRTISQIETLQIDRTLDSGLDLDETGLADPAYTVNLEVSNGGVFTLYLGDVTITGTSYYARMVGKPPVVISKYGMDMIINLIDAPPVHPPATPTTEIEGGG